MKLTKNQNSSKKETIAGGMTILLSMLTGLLMGLLILPDRRPVGMELSKLDQTLLHIERHYVDMIDADSLSDQMIRATLASLDPHSYYLSAEELRRNAPMMQGGYCGVGITLFQRNDTICVSQVHPGGPADVAGLQPGDRILSADTANLVGRSSDHAVSLLRGRKGTRVTLAIKRFGEEGQRHATIVRGPLSTPSISFSGMIDQRHGLIMLNRFCETTSREFRAALVSLKEQGMQHLVIDLRDNTGGLLSAAIDIVDELLPGKETILYCEGAHERRETVCSRPGGLWSEGRLTVVVNEYSASASEIVAGAIQDNDRGLVVGRRTFGKGLVQSPFELSDGSCIFLTTGRYHTPSGRCIQRPYDKGNDEYYLDYLLRIAVDNGADSALLRPTDTTRYFTTSGRVVYGGGGILPDHTIRHATDSLYIYYNELVGKHIVGDYAFDYVTTHLRALRAQYATEEDFFARFTVTDAMLREVVARGQHRGIAPNNRSLAAHGHELRTLIKALIGDHLFTNQLYHRILLQTDTELQQAIRFQ